jgi:hypothetical protein
MRSSLFAKKKLPKSIFPAEAQELVLSWSYLYQVDTLSIGYDYLQNFTYEDDGMWLLLNELNYSKIQYNMAPRLHNKTFNTKEDSGDVGMMYVW